MMTNSSLKLDNSFLVMRLKQYWNSSTRRACGYNNTSSQKVKLNIFKKQVFYQVSNIKSTEDVGECVCLYVLLLEQYTNVFFPF